MKNPNENRNVLTNVLFSLELHSSLVIKIIPAPQGNLWCPGPNKGRHGDFHYPEPEASPSSAGRSVREGQIPADSGQAAR